MIYIETGSSSPQVNLAFEEYFLKTRALGEDILMLWQDEPAVVVGRFQNTLEEIDPDYVQTHTIPVIRRISGGGAVYHDPGNLCFSFIFQGLPPLAIDRPKFARPLVEALAHIGLKPELTPRSDMLIDGKKFSGNAMALHKDRLLYHGTLLFDSDLDILRRVLHAPAGQVESKGVKSVHAGVTNLRPYLPVEMDLEHFKAAMKNQLLSGGPWSPYSPTADDLAAIRDLVESKYLSWDWNFGNNPHCIVSRSGHYSDGTIEIQFELEKGRFKDCHFSADLAGASQIDVVARKLNGLRFEAGDIRLALAGLEGPAYFGPFHKEEVIRCLLGVINNSGISSL